MTTAAVDVWSAAAARLAQSPAPSGHDVWERLAEAADPARWRPRLAPDVEVVRFDYQRGAHAMLGRSAARSYLTVTPAEADLVEHLDGTHSVGDLVAGALTAGADVDPAAAADLVRSLAAEGFLHPTTPNAEAAVAHALQPATLPVRVRRAFTSMSVEWRGAQGLVAWVYRAGAWIWFTKVGLALGLVLSAAGFAAFVGVLTHEGFALRTVGAGGELLAVLVLDLALVAVHEMGHATALIRYGRRVNGAGARLYFGTPAFFIDSSDGLLCTKGQRIVQALAGPWFELMATGAASLVLYAGVVAGADGLWVQVLYRFAVINWYVLLLNLVPLLELDGYWVLSDSLEWPDLRPRSLTFVRGELWRRLLRGPKLTRREWALAAYGTIGVAFTVTVVVSSVFFWQRLFGDTVTALWHGGPLGLAALALGVLLLGGPIVRALGAAVKAIVASVTYRARRLRFRAERGWRVDAARLLDAHPLFGDLPVAALNEIAGRVTLRRFGVGAPIARVGERAGACWLLRAGSVEVLDVDVATGAARRLRVLGPGALFGELALLTGSTRTATCAALEPVEAFEIGRGTFDRLIAVRAESIPDYVPSTAQLAELREVGLLGRLDAAGLLAVAEHGRWRLVAAGEAVVTQGDTADGFYVIGDGTYEVVEDGVVKRQLGGGDHFGELALLLGSTRTASVVAVTPGRVFFLPAVDFDRVVRDLFRSGRAAAWPEPARLRVH